MTYAIHDDHCFIDTAIYCRKQDCANCPWEFDIVTPSQPISKGKVKVRIKNIFPAQSLEKEGE